MRHSSPRFRAAVVALFAILARAVAAAQALPDPKALMEKHNTAAGTRAALDKHTSIEMTATMSMPAMGMEASMEVLRGKPNKFVQKMVIGPVGEIITGFDGTVAWTTNPMMGAQLIQGDQLASIKSNADFFSNMQDPANYSKAETVELTDFEGRKCYKVRLTREGRDGFEYFDAQTGLLAGFSGTVQSSQGPIETTTVFTEWGEVGGIKFPMKLEQRTPNGPATITFTKIEFDKVDPSAFNLPDAVKALVKP
ncbi:MAG: hypothetical protein U9Q74_03950 [Gemmatimonadota bacterium]|nr:hypothetical protein [Gemmatimonadota bacterium]